MKGLLRAPLILGLVFLAGGGCFSHINKHGIFGDSFGSQPKPSVGSTVVAAAADLVTMPVQGPLIVLSAPQRRWNEAVLNRRSELLPVLQANPDIIFERGWHLTPKDKKTVEWEVIQLSLREDHVRFTEAQLRRLYREMTMGKAMTLINRAASEAFLQEAWQEHRAAGSEESRAILEMVVNSEKTSADALREIAADPKRYGTLALHAQYALNARAREIEIRLRREAAPGP